MALSLFSLNASAECFEGSPNGTLEEGEACDDGNTISGDGCSSDCRYESAFEISLTNVTPVYDDGLDRGWRLSDSTPGFRGNTEPGAFVTVRVKSGASTLSSCSTEAFPSGAWSCYIPASSALSDGTYTVQIVAEHPLDPNATATFTETLVVIAVPALAITSVNIDEPIHAKVTSISGLANPKASVSLSLQSELHGIVNDETEANDSGEWTISFAQPLGNGTWSLSAEMINEFMGYKALNEQITIAYFDCEDPDGNDCDDNAACMQEDETSLTCECLPGYVGDGSTCVQPPFASIANLTSGVLIRTATPTFEGVANESAEIVATILDSDSAAAYTITIQADESGDWRFTVEGVALAAGAYTLALSVSTQEVTEPTVVNFAFGVDLSDTILINSPAPGAVVGRSPRLFGSSEPLNELTILLNGIAAGSALSDANGHWEFSFDESAPLPYGAQRVTVTYGDGDPGTLLEFVVERNRMPVSISMPQDGSATLYPALRIEGIGEPYDSVQLFLNGEEVAVLTLSDLGSWRWKPESALAPGVYTLEIRGSDGSSEEVTFSILAPVEPPPVPQPEEESKGFLGCSSSSSPPISLIASALALLLVLGRRRSKALN